MTKQASDNLNTLYSFFDYLCVDQIAETIKITKPQLFEIIENNLSEFGYYSESDLSENFDELLEESGTDIEELGYGVYEEFNNYADSCLSDELLHELQYNNYEYIGKYQIK